MSAASILSAVHISSLCFAAQQANPYIRGYSVRKPVHNTTMAVGQLQQTQETGLLTKHVQ